MSKRTPPRPAPPAPLPVPRVRALRSDEIAPSTDVPESNVTRPRRNRKPKFVF